MEEKARKILSKLNENWERKRLPEMNVGELKELCSQAQELLRTSKDYNHAERRMERLLGKVRIPVGFKFTQKVKERFKDDYREQFSDFEEMKEDEMAYRGLLYSVFVDMVEDTYRQFNVVDPNLFINLESNRKLT